MATQEVHEQAWRSNREFLATITPDYSDWTIAVAFYTALHVIDWLLVAEENSCSGHYLRNQVLKQTNRYQKIWRHYQPLYNASIVARYKSCPTPFAAIDDVRRFIDGNLTAIERSVLKLLGKTEEPAGLTWAD